LMEVPLDAFIVIWCHICYYRSIAKGYIIAVKMDYYSEASRILKAELVRRGISYKALAEILGDENYVQVKTKISRGSFSAGFLIKVLRAIGVGEIDISHREGPPIRRGKNPGARHDS